jgi:hypothetical protein
MHTSIKKRIDAEVQNLLAMHAKRQQLECPCHELAFDEDDFQRVFGAGDEQQHKPRRVDQLQFDHGCRDGDYA